MSITEILLLIILSAGVWFWLDSLRAWEIIQKSCKKACQAQGLNFLDDAVVLSKLRLRRGVKGHVVFYREYRFEFSSDGSHRYQGLISLLGKHIKQIELEPFRQPASIDD